jgi:uncharacterized membrane protein YeaQ/YmgE (transglycosylase-associated protein family)
LRVWRFVVGAPLTFSWLTALLFTTIIQHSLSPERLNALLRSRSTNLHHLIVDPERVLFTSLLWIDGRYWWPYLIVFSAFLAPAERWLGSRRWLATGLLAHVVATYLSQAYVYWIIQQAQASPRLLDARDIGVSYFVAGIVGVLAYRIPPPKRWAYLTLVLLGYFGALVADFGFTPLGHAVAVLVGLACYPLTRGRLRPAAAA